PPKILRLFFPALSSSFISYCTPPKTVFSRPFNQLFALKAGANIEKDFLPTSIDLKKNLIYLKIFFKPLIT
ncbi:MAG: hypothetical protein RBU28_09515, partial [Bacteroidales bacterium]|nr:hypothetical protein [Bacteroidales bacterium]